MSHYVVIFVCVGCRHAKELLVSWDCRAQAMSLVLRFQVVDSRDYFLPHRRHRCWMWAMASEGDPRGLLQRLVHPCLRMDDILDGGTVKPSVLNARQQEVVATVVDQHESRGGCRFKDLNSLFLLARPFQKWRHVSKIVEDQCEHWPQNLKLDPLNSCEPQKDPIAEDDLIIDVAKSSARAPSCIGACTCIVPNSLPYRMFENRVLSTLELRALQGLFPDDFVALRAWASEVLGTFSFRAIFPWQTCQKHALVNSHSNPTSLKPMVPINFCRKHACTTQ